ncbi:MAG: peptide-methionine (S)-S-oxide reductase MsrA [Anaerolineaceae bacterium]|nr:peptide-methionine (S)-S-oxide reductase MsrA [Anaerolineaceae bacterium]
MKNAYFAGGCFWCIAPVFREMEGVASVTSGYCGGDEENPSYEDVKAQRTHHRETICVEYDPAVVFYRDLLTVFLESVDPFDANGQFIDRGASYTLALFYQEPSERTAAEEMLADLAAVEGKPAAVSIEPYKHFWPAEAYHQDYDLKNPEAFARELEESGRGNISCPLRFRKKRVK